MIKTVSKLGMEKNFLNWIKVNYQNSTVIYILPNCAASEAGFFKKKKNQNQARGAYEQQFHKQLHRQKMNAKRPYPENIWLLDPFGIFWFRGHHNFHICCKYFACVQFHISI